MPSVSGQVLPFERYDVQAGLTSNWVSAIYSDTRGYLWIGTDNGLAVYDGLELKNYGIRDGLPSAFVIAIVEDPAAPGTLFIGTHGDGLVRFVDGEVQEVIRPGNGFMSNIIQALIYDDGGALWMQAGDGVWRMRNDSLEQVLAAFDREGGPYIIPAGPGEMWLSVDSVLYRYTDAGGLFRGYDVGIAHDKFTCHSLDTSGTIWLGNSYDLICKVVDGRVVASKRADDVFFRDMIDDGEGYLWFSTGKGLFKVQKENFPDGEYIRYTEANGLADRDLRRAWRDREGNLWFGSTYGGLFKLAYHGVYTFAREETRYGPINNPAAVAVGRTLFCNTAGGVLEVRKQKSGNWRTHLHDLPVLRDAPNRYTLLAGGDALWLAVNGSGLYKYSVESRGELPSMLSMKRALTSGAVMARRYWSMWGDGQELWISASSGGFGNRTGRVVRIDAQRDKVLDQIGKQDGVPEPHITCMLRDREGRMWLGGFTTGVTIFRREGDRYLLDRRLDRRSGLGGDDITALLERDNGEIWVGTRFNGASIWRGDSVQTLLVDDGLLSDNVHSLAEDASGADWIATSIGVQKARVEGKSIQLTPVSPLGRRQFNFMNIYPDGAALYGVERERVTHFDFAPHDHQPPPVTVTINSLKVNGQPAAGETLTEGENLYEISFISVSLRDGRGVRYHHRLMSDQGTSFAGVTSERTVQYTSLAPGKYRFEVAAVSAGGIFSQEPARYTFVILPPVWQRWWFILLGGGMLGAVMYVLHRMRLNRALALERIRSRIATDLHDDIGAGLTHIGLLSEVALRRQLAARRNGEPLPGAEAAGVLREMSMALGKVGDMARELSVAMSDVVWSINPQHDSVAALHRRLRSFANAICIAGEIRLQMDVAGNISGLKLDAEVRRNLLLIAREGLHNAAKYSETSTIAIRMALAGREIELVVEDHGRGFDINGEMEGNGLASMRSRAEKLGGRCQIWSASGEGTRVTAQLPCR